jgi:hypothetical protein
LRPADPIDRLFSKVAAVGCFFPLTDFRNYGSKGNEMIDRQFQPPFTAATDWHEFDAKKASFVPIKDKERLLRADQKVSPTWQVTNHCPFLNYSRGQRQASADTAG